MEAVTVYITKYASRESQMAYITSSFTEYLRIKALEFMSAEILKCLSYEKRPKAHDTFASFSMLNSSKRYSRNVDSFSTNGVRCIKRTRLQLENRFKPQTEEDALVVFLDPRTACYAEKMITNFERALAYFEAEVKRVEALISKKFEMEGSTTTDANTSNKDDSESESVDDDDDLLDAPKSLFNETDDFTTTMKWFKTCSEINWSEFRQQNKDP